jgi:hypothetical protein
MVKRQVQMEVGGVLVRLVESVLGVVSRVEVM